MGSTHAGPTGGGAVRHHIVVLVVLHGMAVSCPELGSASMCVACCCAQHGVQWGV